MESLATVEKAVDVLFHLHAEPAARGVTAIGRALGLPKSSTHRVLSALARRGLVERDERGCYRPGFALVALGLGALAAEPLVAAARPVLAEEARALDETVFLVAPRAGVIAVLDKAEGSGFLRAAPQVGSSVPAHATAVGKLFLALAPEAVSLPEGALTRFTERTRVAAALESELQAVRERGFAENRDEWISGLAAVAAPVVANGRLAAAVAVAAPTARLEALGRVAVARRAISAGLRIAARLEGRQS